MKTFDENEYYDEQFDQLTMSSIMTQATEFDSCIFQNCDFSDSQFRGCKFIDCQFNNCNLSVSTLNHCKFSDVVFDQCKLIGIDWTRIDWSTIINTAPLKFYRCKLSDSSFFGLTLHEIVFEDCELRDVDFREADLTKGSFVNSQLENALFNKTNCSQANFTDASDYFIDILENNIQQATFTRFDAVNLLSSLNINLVD